MRAGRLIELVICIVLGAILSVCIARVGYAAAKQARTAIANYEYTMQKEKALIEGFSLH